MTTTIKLANEFIKGLEECLTADQLAELREGPQPERHCKSHEYVDANQVMIDAYETVFEIEVDLDDQVIDQAWQLAKKNNFNTIQS